jgi:hypothetical protein
MNFQRGEELIGNIKTTYHDGFQMAKGKDCDCDVPGAWCLKYWGLRNNVQAPVREFSGSKNKWGRRRPDGRRDAIPKIQY